MPNVKVSGQILNIDVEEELREFDWERPKWSSDKLIAASPFRDDRTPSFFVFLDGELAGVFGDSGAFEDDFKSGSLAKLLSFLRGETYEETCVYLLEKYGGSIENRDFRLILPKMPKTTRHVRLNRSIVDSRISPYLTKRGISDDVQLAAQVGKSTHKYHVAIPWFTPTGILANVKYRATRGKTFFYERGATPISSLVYGAELYVKDNADLIVCEAEIDAMSWRTAGYNAVAVGGSSFTQDQAEILRRLPFRKLIIAGDNDLVGNSFNVRILNSMRKYRTDIAIVDWHTTLKDANDVLTTYGADGLHYEIERLKEIDMFGLKLRS